MSRWGHCCYGTCKSDSRYDRTIRFYPFPKPCLLLRNNILTWSKSEENQHVKICKKCGLCKDWMIRCKRVDIKFQMVRQITAKHVICQKHFAETPAVMDYEKFSPLPAVSPELLLSNTERSSRVIRRRANRRDFASSTNHMDDQEAGNLGVCPPPTEGSSARMTAQTIHTSNDVTCIKEELVDDAIEDYYKIIKEELPENDINIADPLSISCDIKEETQTPMQTGSDLGLPDQASAPPTVTTDVKEEWIDDVASKDIEKDDITNSVREAFAVKEENDIMYRQIGAYVESEQAGPPDDVMIEVENVVGKAQRESGAMPNITLKKNKICDPRETYSCYICAYSSESKAKLRRHIVVHFEGKPYVCGSRFLKAHDLRQKMTQTQKIQYTCDVCQSKLSQSSYLKSHIMLTHKGEKPYACHVCESRFTLSCNLKRHMLTHSGEKPYTCDVCESRFSQSSHFKRHMLTHSGEKPYTCDVCESRFTRSSSLKCHKLTLTLEKPYACDFCEPRFAHSSHLKNHMRTHTGEKPYTCDVCESRFSQSSPLKRHMRTHTGEKPDTCDVCESRFAQSSSLKCHKLTHNGEKPYTCDVCESRFTRSSSLKCHKLTHNGEKPYACDVCESRFAHSSHLKNHMRTHTGEKPYTCDVCDSRFSQSSPLKRHMRTHTGEKLILVMSVSPDSPGPVP